MKEPVTGIMVANSPRDCLEVGELDDGKHDFAMNAYITKNTITPTREKLIRIPAGPARRSAFPDPTRRPGPMIPERTSAQFKFAVTLTACLQ